MIDNDFLRLALISAKKHGLLPELPTDEVLSRTESFKLFLEDIFSQRDALNDGKAQEVFCEKQQEILRSLLINETTLSKRTKTVLVRGGVLTVGVLMDITLTKLLSLSGLGGKCYAEIEEFLSVNGLDVEANCLKRKIKTPFNV